MTGAAPRAKRRRTGLKRSGTIPTRRSAAQRKTVSTGGGNRKRLKRAVAKLSIDLPRGGPILSPGMTISVTGFKSEIDATRWLIASAEHAMNGNGLKSRIELEVAV